MNVFFPFNSRHKVVIIYLLSRYQNVCALKAFDSIIYRPDRPSSVWLTLPPQRAFGGTGGKELTANAGDTRDAGSRSGPGRSPGGQNGNPLQHSCLGNPWTEEPGGLQFVGLQRVSTTEETQHRHSLMTMTGMRGSTSIQCLEVRGADKLLTTRGTAAGTEQSSPKCQSCQDETPEQRQSKRFHSCTPAQLA